MRLRILAVGKLKQAGLEALVNDYCRRSRSLVPVELVHVRNLETLRNRAQSARDGPRVVLDERGEQITSKTLAAWLGAWRAAGTHQVDFLIGDAHGFDNDDRRSAARVMALSHLTLPHRLAQVLLVEQLYRAGTILAGHPYHHH